MIGTIAAVTGTGFVALAIYRAAATAPAIVARVAMVLAFLAAVLGAAHWQAGADSRWIVGSMLIFFAFPITALSARSQGLRIAAAVLGLLGTLLYVIATATAR